jgi:hypothetical protein
MKRLDSVYWTDGKDIFRRDVNEFIKVTGEDSTTEDSTTEDSSIVDSGSVVVFRIGKRPE